MAYMTYKWYILSNKLPDSKESYREYVRKYETVAAHMNEAMFEQYVEKTYRLRFIAHAWM